MVYLVKINKNLANIPQRYYTAYTFKVSKTIIAKQYGCSVENLYNFLNRLNEVA
jgi:hypothetical protein